MIYVPDRANSKIIKSEAKGMKTVATWATGDCVQPVALDIDRADKRLIFACRGTKPIVVVMDADTGKIVATMPAVAGPMASSTIMRRRMCSSRTATTAISSSFIR
jgi:hypothetical protein